MEILERRTAISGVGLRLAGRQTGQSALQLTLERVEGVKLAKATANRIEIGLDDLARTTPAVMQALAAQGVAVRHLGSGRANLEDVFLQLTGRQLRD